MLRTPFALPALVIALVGVLVVGCTSGSTTASAPPTQAVPVPSASPPGGEVDLPSVVERLSPSVVTINTGDGVGSGVVYRDDVVITNQHVVGEARRVTVEYADGTTSGGTVLATDGTTDLAVVRTERTGLPVPRYRTELPRPGETVLAIGSPLGFENSVTAGIVSGLNRQIPGSAGQSRALVDLIQVDAAISPGNSGGALLDAAGNVIGINEAYIPPTAGAVSLGFAIPAATVVNVAEQLLTNGRAVHPYLGVSLGRLTPDLRRQLGVAAESGALVLSVEQGGPAASAGVRPGDVIVELAGTKVESVEDLLGALRNTEPGRQVALVVDRGGRREELTVTIGSATGG